jgi:DNA invertase Pin-like site-specific DNA recombinase
MKKEVRAAIYARVSTNSGQNPDMQLAELREYCGNRGWKVTGEYVDRGVSGTQDARPALARLMADAQQHRFSVVAVWKFDRFARSVQHLLRALDSFRLLKIDFVSVTEQIDTSTAAGILVYTVLGAVSALEASLIAERVKTGLRNAKSKGVRLGRPPLRDLSATEICQLRRDRRRRRLSFKSLAAKYRVSVWTAFRVCKAKD